MGKLAHILKEKTERAERYNRLLAEVEFLQTPCIPDGCVHSYQSYVCLFQPETPSLNNVIHLYEQRNALMMRLEAKGIATRQGTHAPVILGYYAEKYALRPGRFPNAYLADRLSLALPLYPQMTKAEQTLVVAETQRIFDEL
ncbi:DegT/DnrJ/EryC1/StrS family aminotransferase [Candidatus Poribacteria bacterium]|nr:DegT/DnrJ/EryC1/StrS family aminotransferase [Candidatus Poribacteria bacterium]